MILSGKAISQLIENKILKISPTADIKEASIKVHLSSKMGKERGKYGDYKEYLLQPKKFVLALSQESFEFPSNYAGMYDNHIYMSSKGVLTHLGSMLVEPKFSGQILLEIFNTSDQPCMLESGMRVGNLMIIPVSDSV